MYAATTRARSRSSAALGELRATVLRERIDLFVLGSAVAG